MINWTVRIKNKNFWLAIIPAVVLLAQAVAAVFGISLELGGLLVILGVVNDPTTEGLGDSRQAMGYNYPKSK